MFIKNVLTYTFKSNVNIFKKHTGNFGQMRLLGHPFYELSYIFFEPVSWLVEFFFLDEFELGFTWRFKQHF